MIVTTAKIYICDVDYGTADLDAGEVASLSGTPVSVVRFQKTLGFTDPGRSSAKSIEDLAEQSGRTVVVVQASYFPTLLAKWDLGRNLLGIGLREALLGS